ncbi:MAG TPA: amidase [Actinomycetota bacterium]|nr:amidase [Actinomycetota bacterium]
MAQGELETASQMAVALVRREVSAAELVERALERAQAWQPVTNAFSQLWEEAREEARRTDALRARGGGGGPFAGIPLAVKDLFDVAGRETTGCSLAYRGRVADRDAPVVERLQDADLVLVGKTNQHELAAGGTNLVSACGPTRNPWDPARMTGGSSGGSGAAVASGVVPWALGSDTGGSIRIPAAMCGTFGLKPTTGRFPLDGMLPLAPSMDCPGPMAATAEDLWILYGLMGGHGHLSLTPRPWLLETKGRSFRVGVPDGFFAERIHDEVLAAVEATARVLEGAGVAVEAVDGRAVRGVRSTWARVCYPEFAAAHPGIDRGLLHPSVRAWMEEGERFTPEERAEAARRRAEVARWFRERLEALDALLIPTTPYPAPRADQAEVDLGSGGTVAVGEVGPGWITCSVNLAGLPALSLPTAVSREGVPVGVSLVGREDDEEALVRLAVLWEAASGYRPRWPTPPS